MYIAVHCCIESIRTDRRTCKPKQLMRSQFSIADDFGQTVVNLPDNAILNVGYAYGFGWIFCKTSCSTSQFWLLLRKLNEALYTYALSIVLLPWSSLSFFFHFWHWTIGWKRLVNRAAAEIPWFDVKTYNIVIWNNITKALYKYTHYRLHFLPWNGLSFSRRWDVWRGAGRLVSSSW